MSAAQDILSPEAVTGAHGSSLQRLVSRPYYEDAFVKLYHGDAVAIMQEMEKETVDVFVTDPPYGTKTDNRGGWMVGERANVMPIMLPEMYRAGKSDAALYLFTSWRHLADWAIRCSTYFPTHGILVMDKGRHSGCWGKFSWQFHWEGIIYGLKGPRPIRKYQPDVIRSKERGGESMQKPVDVLSGLIEASSDAGQTICDPFCGTGGTLVAAKRLGRKVIGIEIDERYAEMSANRCASELPMTQAAND